MEATATPEQIQNFALSAGDVVITKDSETPDDIAVAARVDGSAAGVVCGYHLALLRPIDMRVDPRYLFWSLKSKDTRDQFSAAATGITRFGLRIDSIADVRLPVHDRARQQAIADFLDAETTRIDDLIAKKSRIVDLLELRMVTTRDEWAASLFAHWGAVPLRRVIGRVEQGWSPQCENVEAAPDEWGVLKTSAVSGTAFRPHENKRLPSTVTPDSRWIVRDGDLLMTRGSGSLGMVGRVSVATTEGRRLLLSDLIYRIVLRNAALDFLARVLEAPSVRQRVESAVRTDVGQTLKIRVEDIKGLPIPSLPPEVQVDAVESLEKKLAPMRQARALLARQVALLREHRQALITAAVTGQLDLPGAAA